MTLSNIALATEIIGIVIMSVVFYRYFKSEKRKPAKSHR